MSRGLFLLVSLFFFFLLLPLVTGEYVGRRDEGYWHISVCMDVNGSGSEWEAPFLDERYEICYFPNYSFPWGFSFFWAVLALHVSGLGGFFEPPDEVCGIRRKERKEKRYIKSNSFFCSSSFLFGLRSRPTPENTPTLPLPQLLIHSLPRYVNPFLTPLYIPAPPLIHTSVPNLRNHVPRTPVIKSIKSTSG